MGAYGKTNLTALGLCSSQMVGRGKKENGMAKWTVFYVLKWLWVLF